MAGDFDTAPEDYAEDVAKAKFLGVIAQVKQEFMSVATVAMNAVIIEAVCDELTNRVREM